MEQTQITPRDIDRLEASIDKLDNLVRSFPALYVTKVEAQNFVTRQEWELYQKTAAQGKAHWSTYVSLVAALTLGAKTLGIF